MNGPSPSAPRPLPVCGSRRLSAPMVGQSGHILIAVLAVTVAVLLMGSALFLIGAGESDLVDYTVDSARAFWLAEGGVERARAWLQELAGEFPPVFPDSTKFLMEPLGGGTYSAAARRVPGGSPWVRRYEVVSTGEIGGAVSQVRVILQSETFAQYMYFADEMEEIWFITGDRLDGRVHANGYLHIAGDPWFGMKVTSAEDEMIVRSGSDPTFEGGYELGVEEIPLPVPADLAVTVRADAQADGVYGGPLSGRYAKYEVILGREGWVGSLSYRSYSRIGGSYRWSGWTDVYIPDTNGMAWFDEPVHVQGVLDGQLTIGSSEDVYISDDIIYEDSTPGHGPDVGGDDVLGLVSAGNVIVEMTPANMDDVEIHAHMLALDRSFTAERYWDGPPRGTLTLYGGFAQQRQGAVGQFNYSGIIHGYQKDYHYDMNLLTHSPPGYPPTGKYRLVLWEEVTPPQV